MQEIDSIFKDSPYLHLGGDEVFGACWDLRPAIKSFMRTKLILNYGALQMYWRHQMKQALSANRTVVYWRNDAESIKTAKDDVIHYWGSEADV
jgi:N-acetyl-beta-hexosaminidase